jgi:hypothetical protein
VAGIGEVIFSSVTAIRKRRVCGLRWAYPARGTGLLPKEGIKAACVHVGRDDIVGHHRNLRAYVPGEK